MYRLVGGLETAPGPVLTAFLVIAFQLLWMVLRWMMEAIRRRCPAGEKFSGEIHNLVQDALVPRLDALQLQLESLAATCATANMEEKLKLVMEAIQRSGEQAVSKTADRVGNTVPRELLHEIVQSQELLHGKLDQRVDAANIERILCLLQQCMEAISCQQKNLATGNSQLAAALSDLHRLSTSHGEEIVKIMKSVEDMKTSMVALRSMQQVQKRAPVPPQAMGGGQPEPAPAGEVPRAGTTLAADASSPPAIAEPPVARGPRAGWTSQQQQPISLANAIPQSAAPGIAHVGAMPGAQISGCTTGATGQSPASTTKTDIARISLSVESTESSAIRVCEPNSSAT